jgi:hypothetical protein
MNAALRTWTITVAAPTVFLTENERRRSIAKADDVSLWRGAVKTACQRARLPQDVSCRVRIAVTYRFAGRPPVNDLHNIMPTSKAIIDGLTPQRVVRTKTGANVHIGYGLIPGDTDRWVDGPHHHRGEPLPAKPYGPRGEVEITVTELGTAGGPR